MYPKPTGGRSIPIIVGGESDAAIARAARLGDGWNAINLPVAAAVESIALLKQQAREHGREADRLRIIATIFPATPLAELARYRDAGVTEFNLMTGDVPTGPAELEAHLGELAERFVQSVAKW